MTRPLWPASPRDKPQRRTAGYRALVRTDAQRSGDGAERLVADRLTAAGWSMLARNVHVGRYELDLVAVDPGPPRTLVAVEVRWRAARAFGLPEETVDHRKRSRVRGGSRRRAVLREVTGASAMAARTDTAGCTRHPLQL